MADKVFVDGMIVKDAKPDFVKCKVSISCKEFDAFMNANHKNGWLNIDVKESKNGKLYAELDTWEPKSQQEPEDDCPW